ncbi:hypothetical protein SUDANB108_06862 [Streptomyces sp. enrichment culture]
MWLRGLTIIAVGVVLGALTAVRRAGRARQDVRDAS